MNKQLIAFKRGKLLLTGTENLSLNVGDKRTELLLSFIQELKTCGYYLSEDIISRITEKEILEAHESILPWLSEKYHLEQGTEFIPLYPGFPQQVISKTEAELILNAELVYSGKYDEFIKTNPWYSETEKIDIKKNPGKLIKGMSEEEFNNIPKQITSSGFSITKDTKDDLVWLLENFPEIKVAERIPFKETLCIVMKYKENYEPRGINDILRYAFYEMGADPALIYVPKTIGVNSWRSDKIENPEWRNLESLKRSTRRKLVKLIDELTEKLGLENVIPDAKRFYGHWLLLSERLHPGEYKKFKNCIEFFSTLKSKESRTDDRYRTWESKVQKMYDEKKPITEIAKFISTHPGEFTRKFDSLLRRAGENNEEPDIMDIFIGIEGIKNKTLLELMKYYDRRIVDAPRLVKNKSSNVRFKLKDLPALPPEMIQTIQEVIMRKIFLNIESRIETKDLDGKLVYIDPKIKNIPIPGEMRSSDIQVPAGIKFEIPKDKNIIRTFVHWIQEDIDEDLDLAVLFLDETLKKVGHIGWNTRQVGKDFYAVHSGDVLNREGNCAEYVDIDIKVSLKQGFRYAVMTVHNYKGRGLDTLPCWLGYCYREKLKGRDLLWSPENVESMQKIGLKDANCAAFLVDLKERTIKIINESLNGLPVFSGDCSKYQSIIKFYGNDKQVSCYDLLRNYCISRGAVDILDSIPKESNELEIAEKYEFDDIANDYVKILNIIGE